MGKRKTMRGWMPLLPVLLALGGQPDAGAVQPVVPPPSPAEPASEASAPARVSIGRRLLWYVPNRCMDLLDIFRFRVRLGPGLAAGVRVTDFGAFYIGEYYSLYGGLPGPRNPHYLRLPVGAERLKGIVFCGVNATDDTLYVP